MLLDHLKASAFGTCTMLALACGLTIGCSERAAPTIEVAAGLPANADGPKVEQETYDGPLFPALKDGKYGFIDVNGRIRIPPTFTNAGRFSEGLAAVYVGGQAFIAGEKLLLRQNLIGLMPSCGARRSGTTHRPVPHQRG